MDNKMVRPWGRSQIFWVKTLFALGLCCGALGPKLWGEVYTRPVAQTGDGGLFAEMPPLLKLAKPGVFVHFMVGFRTPEVSGSWGGWDWPGGWDLEDTPFGKHNPHLKNEEGRIDIASVFTPAVGPYDQEDPQLAEYHAQLLKLSGVDGGFFDVAYFRRPGSGPAGKPDPHMANYARQFARYGLKAVMVYEDKCRWLWDQTLSNREEAVAAAWADLDGFMEMLKPVSYEVAGRPLVCFFSYEVQTPNRGLSRLGPGELRAWKEKFPVEKRPLILAQWFKPEYQGVLDGRYDWVGVQWGPARGVYSGYAGLAQVRAWQEAAAPEILSLFQKKDSYLFHVTGVTPGFDDRGVFGWGKGNRCLERENGAVYGATWEKALEWKLPLVQVATWNDFYEGTVVEPTVEEGTQYLEATRAYSARLHGVNPNGANLRLPEWIYRVRKHSKDPAVLAAMDGACEQIRNGQFSAAEKMVAPFAMPLMAAKHRPLNIPDRWVKGWATNWLIRQADPARGPQFYMAPENEVGRAGSSLPPGATSCLYVGPRKNRGPAQVARAFRVGPAGGVLKWGAAPASVDGKASAARVRVLVHQQPVADLALAHGGAGSVNRFTPVAIDLSPWKGQEILVTCEVSALGQEPCLGVFLPEPQSEGLEALAQIPPAFLPKPQETWEKKWGIENGMRVVFKRKFGPSGDRPPEGKTNVLQVHPVGKDTPCVLWRKVRVEKGSRLLVSAASDAEQAGKADFLFSARVEGKEVIREVVSAGLVGAPAPWRHFEVDLAPWEGKEVRIELVNGAGGESLWAFEYAYFAEVKITGVDP